MPGKHSRCRHEAQALPTACSAPRMARTRAFCSHTRRTRDVRSAASGSISALPFAHAISHSPPPPASMARLLRTLGQRMRTRALPTTLFTTPALFPATSVRLCSDIVDYGSRAAPHHTRATTHTTYQRPLPTYCRAAQTPPPLPVSRLCSGTRKPAMGGLWPTPSRQEKALPPPTSQLCTSHSNYPCNIQFYLPFLNMLSWQAWKGREERRRKRRRN